MDNSKEREIKKLDFGIYKGEPQDISVFYWFERFDSLHFQMWKTWRISHINLA